MNEFQTFFNESCIFTKPDELKLIAAKCFCSQKTFGYYMNFIIEECFYLMDLNQNELQARIYQLKEDKSKILSKLISFGKFDYKDQLKIKVESSVEV